MTASEASIPPHHIPVMRERVFALLAPALETPSAVLVDATLGLGGHAEYFLEQLPHLRLVGLDRDELALAHSRERLAPFADRITLVHAVYDEIPRVLAELGHPLVSGVLFDLGVSSMQLDDHSRGFSYAHNTELDMRMDRSRELTAAQEVNEYSEKDIARILKAYGDERFAHRIAKRIAHARTEQPITTSAELVEIVRESIPAAARRVGGNPAKRTFQALRIEVNDELGILRRALPAALNCLAVHGRMVVMSYQSLEDIITKTVFRDACASDVPLDLPVPADSIRSEFTLLTRGSEQANEDEVTRNPRASSVRVRAIERLRSAA